MSQSKRISLAQFNMAFKRLLEQAQILEGTSRPKDALPRYFELVDFIVGFVKTPECPAHLRPKLIATSKTLIEKIKKIQNPPEKGIEVPQSSPISSFSHPSESTISDEINEEAFASLPDIPTHLPETDDSDSNQLSKSISSDLNIPPIQSNIKTVPDITSDPPKTSEDEKKSSGGVMDDFLSKIKNFEEELRKMPPGVTEVKPNEFNPYNVLTPKEPNAPALNLDDYKKDTIMLDKTISDIAKSAKNKGIPSELVKKNKPDPGFKISGFKKDPFKADETDHKLQSKPPVDPFTNPDPKELGINKESERICFACSANLPQGSQICPNCGTINE
jgi:hypothetical protein